MISYSISPHLTIFLNLALLVFKTFSAPIFSSALESGISSASNYKISRLNKRALKSENTIALALGIAFGVPSLVAAVYAARYARRSYNADEKSRKEGEARRLKEEALRLEEEAWRLDQEAQRLHEATEKLSKKEAKREARKRRLRPWTWFSRRFQ